MNKRQLLSSLAEYTDSTRHLFKRLKTLQKEVAAALGPLSLFSVLPLEILYSILDDLFLTELHGESPNDCSTMRFFLTCRAARSLRESWCQHMYRKLGGMGQPRSCFQWFTQHYSYIKHYLHRRPSNLLFMDVIVERGCLSSVNTVEAEVHNFVTTSWCMNKHLHPNVVASVTDYALERPAFPCVDVLQLLFMCKYDDDDKWTQVLARALEQTGFEEVVDHLVKHNDENGRIVPLCDTPTKWIYAFWGCLRRGPPKTCRNLYGAFVNFPQIKCWGDIENSEDSHISTLSIHTLLECAPQELLDLPDVVGGVPGRSRVVVTNIHAYMRDQSWERLKLSGVYRPHTTDSVVYSRIVLCGGCKVPLLHFVEHVHDATKAILCLPFVDCSLPHNPAQVVAALLELFNEYKPNGQRMKLLKEIISRTPMTIDMLEELSDGLEDRRLIRAVEGVLDGLYNHQL
jgi:hypothetical protein